MPLHTLIGAQPPTTAAGASPWVSVRIRESEVEAGPWTILETRALSPVDSTPDTASSYDFTFNGQLAVGWYSLIWVNQDGAESPPTSPVLDDGSGVSGGLPVPTTRDVAVLLPTRPRLSGGVTLTDFSADTIPPVDGVRSAINAAHNFLYSKFGDISDPVLNESAGHLIGLYSAMLVELGFFPEQVNRGQSPYPELKKLFDEGLVSMIDALGGSDGSALDDTGGITSLMPSYDFPETSIGDGVMP